MPELVTVALGALSYVALYAGLSIDGTRPRARWLGRAASVVLFAASVGVGAEREGIGVAILLAIAAWTAAGSIVPALARRASASARVIAITARPARERAAVEPRTGAWRAVARALVSMVGTLPVSVLLGTVLAARLPLEESTRLTIGFLAIIPVWIAVACVAFLDARAWRAAGIVAVATLLLVLAA
ncbi:hypothetical protein [Sandaracinus amylolyticus]|uniref:hypothetical protein n=1 Tax=Sandaracinus amylolyticus TaxID=927083 RepID=UPI001F223F87|nr:hypothetical protein [Sandaracinus amylolyticus]UJR82462.1 Hypothetical protein I5071_45270 [Sandaracinus amylolyticus]